ncbi:hypothetical protein OHB44_11725 [Micromonospora sp. NBC_00821]|uniref:hypothetical protein n=1 Tax=Micromonospora sp. NBC_00821 TaxID=2975977 RepID=UPI002ED0B5A4|nr:hypothetical protein OHB44_11725 [Micromonospora sp. NBC_00821]
MGQSSRQSTLKVTLRYPASAFLYRATKPRLRLDGVDVPSTGWGVQRLPVSPGDHRVEVWVPYILPRRAGRALCEITIVKGQGSALEYMAPTVTFARGSLGAPGEQGSTGYSTVMVFNVIAVIVVVAALIAFALT